ncbi:MAG: hypothetical protein H6978_08020 [Gammaproteobacteria bacterium]|nr:hypothetical protein [Gammaproteobacteria bacterium]
MEELTLGEPWERRDALEEQAASVLGHMLFAFSLLDVNLGLYLEALEYGETIACRTEAVEKLNFHRRIVRLEKHVEGRLPAGSERRRAYEAWIQRAQSVRLQRNDLVHGRWGVEARKGKVVNVLGLPTSGNQQVYEYSIEQLKDVLCELRELLEELARLRSDWPLES